MKRRYIIFIVLSAAVIGLVVYVKSLDIPPPHVEDMFCLNLEREKINDSLYIFGNNWLHRSPDGLWEIYLEGNGFERGAAFGKLTQELLEYQEDAFTEMLRQFIPSPTYLRFLRYFVAWFNRKLPDNVPEEYLREIYGVSLSASSQYDFMAPPYLRQLNYHAAHDIGHALQNMHLAGCSSLALWNNRTSDSSLLIGRNFDFYAGERFAENKLICFINPDKGYRLAMISWPGMCGVVSGINEKGLTVTINAAKSDIPTSSATPVSLLAREILQYAATIDEAYAVAAKRNVFVSESFLIGSGAENKAAIIEKSPEKMGLFVSADEQIICTNHFQGEVFADDETNLENIRESDSPYRYARIRELSEGNEPFDEHKIAAILRDTRGVGGKEIGYGNEKAINQLIAHHSVIFKPREGKFWVSTRPYQLGKLVAYRLDDIFALSAEHIRQTKNFPTRTDSIPDDDFLFSKDYADFVRYRQMCDSIKADIRKEENSSINDGFMQRFRQSNPEMYYVYRLSGDWYASKKEYDKAIDSWETALTKEIPRLSEKEYLQDQIRKEKENR